MKIGLIGCGAYGLALSSVMHENKCDITMWTRNEKEKNELETKRENTKKLPGYIIPKEIKITTSLEECIKGKDLIVMAVPAVAVDPVSKEMAPYIKTTDHILIATKGIEQGTGLFMHQILQKYLSTRNLAVISGPSFAVDLITKMPAGLSLAAKSTRTYNLVRKALANDYIKLRKSKDLIGTEVCGSIKNVIAIAAGILSGMKLPESTQAMFITESIHDMKQHLFPLNS